MKKFLYDHPLLTLLIKAAMIVISFFICLLGMSLLIAIVTNYK